MKVFPCLFAVFLLFNLGQQVAGQVCDQPCTLGQTCFGVGGNVAICRCPLGMDAQTNQQCAIIDSRCPPQAPSATCPSLVVTCIPGDVGPATDSVCTDSQLCCGTSNGCDTQCVNIGCLLPSVVAGCNANNEVCNVVSTTTGYTCGCAVGYAGAGCTTRLDLIDAKCPLFNAASVGFCSGAPNEECSAQVPTSCGNSQICCSTGCGTTCVADPDETCTSTAASCAADDKVCYTINGENICQCPFGFGGTDCRTRVFFSPNCPFPSSPVSVCASVIFGCNDDAGCGTGEICCLNDDACSTSCIKSGCSNPDERKVCTDVKKICIDDDAQPSGIRCECPLGYSGDECETRMDGVDDKCKFPSVTDDTCAAITDPPTCANTDGCDDDKICCSTGCDKQCQDPPKTGLQLSRTALLFLLLSSQNRPTRGRTPPPPMCMRSCNGVFCSKNIAARCARYQNSGCFVFYDQYTGLVIPDCRCSGRYYIGCPNYCLNARCPQNPYARCRVTSCGRCEAYWIDIRTGRQVFCR